jgi:hypothetical protein
MDQWKDDEVLIINADVPFYYLKFSNRRVQKWKKPRPPLLVVYLLAVIEQQWNYIVDNEAVVVKQCNYIAALPLPTTMGGGAFPISEVVYWGYISMILYEINWKALKCLSLSFLLIPLHYIDSIIFYLIILT